MRDLLGRFATGGASPLAERFWSHVDKNGPVIRPELGPCWIWTGAVNKQTGYGAFGIGGRTKLAHRVAFLLQHGRWPFPMARHECDHPPCVRHIVEGTASQNSQDIVDRERRVWKKREACVNGHPIEERASGHRVCRTCARDRAARYGRAKRLAATGSEATRVHGTETRCPSGHPYDDANTYRTPSGSRQCRACKKERPLALTPSRKVG